MNPLPSLSFYIQFIVSLTELVFKAPQNHLTQPLVSLLVCVLFHANTIAVPLDKFCEEIPLRALKQFSVAFLTALQRDRTGPPPQDTDPDLVDAWTVLQKKALAMATNFRFSVTSLGPGWTGMNPNGSPPTWHQIDITAQWLDETRAALDTDLEFAAPRLKNPKSIFLPLQRSL